MKNSRIARREFMRRAGLSAGAFTGSSLIFDALFSGIFQKAQAQSLSTTATTAAKINKNYFHISLGGGPPRWMFDLPLAPKGLSTSGFMAGNFGTILTKQSGIFKPEYYVEKHVVSGKTIYLPPLWNMGLANQDFTSLLPNMAFIRGMNMEINAHGVNNARVIAPQLGGISLTGVAADASNLPIPGVIDASTAGIAFKSYKEYAPSKIDYTVSSSTNPTQALLKPFINYTAGRSFSDGSRKQAHERAFDEFENYAAKAGLSSSALTTMYDNAMSLMDANIYMVSSQWNSVYQKYLSIVKEACTPAKGTMPGLMDQLISPSTDASHNFGSGFTNQADLRDIISATTDVPGLAATFALAELTLGKLTSSFCFSAAGPIGFKQANGTAFGVQNDQHAAGSTVSTLATTVYYRALVACLTAYVSQLKADGLFNDTMIHIGAEFNRSPRSDGSGSDHGYNGSGTSIISGMIGEPAIIGNVVKTVTGSAAGTWGIAGNYSLDGITRPIQVNDVARTVSTMMGYTDIVTSGMNLMKLEGGKWKVRLDEANNV